MKGTYIAAGVILALSAAVLVWALWLHYRNRGNDQD